MKRALLLLLALPVHLACTAELTGSTTHGSAANKAGADASKSTTGGSPDSGPAADGGGVDVTPVRLLTDLQYNNAIASLFGIDSRPLTEEVKATGDLYDNDASGLIASPRLVTAYESVAVEVAAQAFDNGSVELDCASGEAEAQCVEDFITAQGTRVFRRPPTNEEAKILTDSFDTLRATPIEDTVEGAAEGILAAMLQMPAFLYHVALGDGGGGEARLSGYEVASRLAFAITNSTPDDELLAAAANGDLDSREGVRAEAERLLDSPSARRGLLHFVDQWMGIENVARQNRDENLYPDYRAALGNAMLDETHRFFEEVAWNEDGDVADLYSADFSFVNAELAELYGMSGDFGDELERVEMPPERRGILTQGSYLTAHSVFDRTSPIARGVYTIRKMLCMDLGSPPNNIGALPQEVSEGGTVRDQLKVHSAGACASCHQFIDPVGLSFEKFDAIGAFRENYESGIEIDATGSVPLDGEFLDVDGGAEFSDTFAGTATATQCFTQQAMSYMLGRRLEKKDNAAVLAVAGDTQNIRELVLNIVTSDPFLYRDVPTPEACE